MGNEKSLLNYCRKYERLFIFLFLELMAFIGFNLGNVNSIFTIVGLLLTFALIPYAIVFVKKEQRLSLLITVIPLFLYSVLVAFSQFTLQIYDILGSFSFIAGGIGCYLLGYLVSKTNDLKHSTLLYVIFGGIGLFVLISFGYTIISYGPLYAYLNDGMHYFYEGFAYPIYVQNRNLIGLEFQDMDLGYLGVFSSVLSCSIFALLFIDYKENRNMFMIFLGLGILGLLSLLLIPNLESLLMFVPVAIVALLIKFYPRKPLAMKILKYSAYVGVGLFAVGFLIFTLNAMDVPGIVDLFSSNSLINRIFNTSNFTRPFNDSIFIMTRPEFFFGVTAESLTSFNALNGTSYTLSSLASGSFIFDIAYEGGLFAFLAMASFVVIMMINSVHYLRKSDHPMYVKVTYISILLTVFFAGNFKYEEYPYIHNESFYVSFLTTSPFIIAMVISGLTFYPFINEEKALAEIKEINELYTRDVEEEGNENE